MPYRPSRWNPVAGVLGVVGLLALAVVGAVAFIMSLFPAS
jgi:hypothetical protein